MRYSAALLALSGAVVAHNAHTLTLQTTVTVTACNPLCGDGQATAVIPSDIPNLSTKTVQIDTLSKKTTTSVVGQDATTIYVEIPPTILDTVAPSYTNVTTLVNNSTQSTGTVTSVTIVTPDDGGESSTPTSQVPVGIGAMATPGLLMGAVGGLIAFLV